MIHVILDTSILSQDPQRNKSVFKMLTKLGEARKIQVYIPYVVKNEFLGQRWDEYSQVHSTGEKALGTMLRKKLSKNLQGKVRVQKEALCRLGPQIKRFVQKDFENWVNQVGAKILPIKSHHGKNVMDSYFAGNPPFSSARNKKDLPDGFIFETIKDHLKNGFPLNVVSSDHNLLAACSDLPNLVTFESMEEFVESDQCYQLLRIQYFEDHFEEIKTKLGEKKRCFKEEINCLLRRGATAPKC